MTEEKKRILVMTSVHPWDDPRIFYKEALSLSKKYQVEVHAPADFQLKEEQGIRIIGLPKYRRGFRFLNWMRLFFRALNSPARYVHFHDPELIPVGIMLRFLAGKKVIYDVHEDFPASIMTKSWIPEYMKKSLARLANFLELRAARLFHGIILAEFSYAERFRPLGVYMETVANYPPRSLGRETFAERMPEGKDTRDGEAGERGPVGFVYAGVISKPRGIIEMIKSFALAEKQGLDFRLFLIGPWVTPELRKETEEMIRNLGLEERVTITGKIPFPELMKIYRQCDVGLALLHPEKNYLTSFATKIFEYMAVGIPVLASNFPLWKVLVLGLRCGVTVNPLDIEAISKKIALLVKRRSWRHRLGMNGWAAFNSYFNWETQEEKLWEFYKKLDG